MNSNRLYRSSGKEKESRYLVFTSSTKREIRPFHVVVVQRRKRNTKAWCTPRVVFLPFSLTSPSSLLKLPTNSNATGNLWYKGRKRNRVHFLFFFSYKHLGGAAHLIAFGMTQRFGAWFCASYVKIGRFLVTELTRINAGPNLNRGMRRSFEDFKKKNALCNLHHPDNYDSISAKKKRLVCKLICSLIQLF